MIYFRPESILLKFILLLLVVLPYSLSGQVTIGSADAPDPSAVLELKTSDKGFLGPRVALTDIFDNTTVPNCTDGLLVFNTADSNTRIAVGDRVKANAYYYWSADRWIQIVGRETLMENIEQGLANLGIPRPAIFSLNGTQQIFNYDPLNLNMAKYPNMYGVVNLLEGVPPNSSAYLPLIEKVNYTSGTVKLDSVTLNGGKKKYIITFQPGIYSIIFTYEFIPADTATPVGSSAYPPGDDYCFSSVYFMQFPVNFINDDNSITKGLTRVESNCFHGYGEGGDYWDYYKQGRFCDHGNTISYVSVLFTETSWDVALGTGQGDDKCNGKTGLSMPNRSTFLYISRLGDAN